MNKKTAVGIMSGTSLDGIDFACTEFDFQENKFSFNLLCAETIPYSSEWKKKLSSLANSEALTVTETNNDLGKLFGTLVCEFIKKNKLKVDFVSSHGHTIFHQPKKGVTLQIGNGANIAALCGLHVVCDFRTLDVALGGQGAPLVPVGDKLLFNEYDYCLNLGGIANISFDNSDGLRTAFDICPVNMILNNLASEKNLLYDKDGQLAAAGKINSELLEELNGLKFYKSISPKSLGYEWFEEEFLPVVQNISISTEDKLRTVSEHIAIQISKVVNTCCSRQNRSANILITGGGAYNSYLLMLLKKKCTIQIIIPSSEIIEFKEAIIFGFLGYLRMHNKVNTLSSVTGASRDSTGGAVYSPF